MLANILSAKSQWTAAEVAAFLDDARQPLRLSSLNAHGFPQITSLWFSFHDEKLWCCTQRTSLAVKQIRRESRIGFEVAVNDPPYFGVSGYGHATVLDQDASNLLHTLTEENLGEHDAKLKRWLLSRVDTEAVIQISPVHLTSWDFRSRMSKRPMAQVNTST